jgi:thiamine-monophosphate kinase
MPERDRVNEFELINRFFSRQPVARGDVALGIGDDAAVLEVPAGMQLVVSTDTLNSGVHFPADTDPVSVGHKSLAVNLSDLAAMGATPAWFTLNLSMPQADENWLTGYCRGLFALAARHGIALVGGDTTRGPLAISIQVCGLVPAGQALLRSGARPGDGIYVTGTLGDAALGLMQHQGRLDAPAAHREQLLQRLHCPAPRVQEGLRLREVASSCIDISDGLCADLGHILERSGVGARIELDRIPVSDAYCASRASLTMDPALTGGDDYELCFTVPAQREAVFARTMEEFSCLCTRIGVIESLPGLRIIDAAGGLYHPAARGYDHFSTA